MTRAITVQAPRRRQLRLRTRETLAFYTVISPWLIGLAVFTAGPIVMSLVLSFTNWNSFQEPDFVGVDNYVTLISDDPLFWKALRNTFLYVALSLPASMLIALVLARLLARPRWGRGFFRTVIYLPVVVPLVATAMIFQWVLAPKGPLNEALSWFGIRGPAWLHSPDWLIPSVVLLALWQVGAGTILLIAGFNSIPQQIHEAAEVDGANAFQRFIRMEIPLVTPILFFNLITGIIGGFQVFAQVYVLTDGTSGPDKSALMLVPYLFQTAFRDFRMGYASALAWVLFAVIMALSLISVRSSRRWVYYETETRR